MVSFLGSSRLPVAYKGPSVRLPLVCSALGHSNGNIPPPGLSSKTSNWLLSVKNRSVFGGLGSGGFVWAASKEMRMAVSGKASDVTHQRDSNLYDANETSSSNSKQTKTSPQVGGLVLVSGATVIPHPSKVDKGGEDAYFLSANKKSIGVADGVGGWAQVGIDSGEYSQMLMTQAKQFADKEKEYGAETPKQMLADAHVKTPLPGSSTACVMSLDSHKSILYAANLGDSGFFVFRDGKIVFLTQPQQLSFNTPYQLGYDTSESNKPEQAQDIEVPVQPGDIIVAATDGLWDNLFPEECSTILRRCQREGQGPQQMSLGLGICAEVKSQDRNAITPFLVNAQRNGVQYTGGGKPDDITVVVSLVSQAQSKL